MLKNWSRGWNEIHIFIFHMPHFDLHTRNRYRRPMWAHHVFSELLLRHENDSWKQIFQPHPTFHRYQRLTYCALYIAFSFIQQAFCILGRRVNVLHLSGCCSEVKNRYSVEQFKATTYNHSKYDSLNFWSAHEPHHCIPSAAAASASASIAQSETISCLQSICQTKSHF